MSVNLIEILKNAVTDQTVDAIGKHAEMETSSVKTGLGAIVPTVLAALLGKNTDTSAAAPAWFESIPGLFNDNAGSITPQNNIDYVDLLTKGKSLLGNLFGNNTETVASAVAQNAGIQPEKSKSLLALAVPFVLSYLSRWMKSKNWTFGNLITNLLENKQSLVAALPGGLSAASFFSANVPPVPETPKVEIKTEPVTRPVVTETRTTTPISDPKKTNNSLKWLLWALLAALLLWLLLSKGCKSCSNEERVYNDTTTVVAVGDTTAVTLPTAEIKGKLNEAGDWVYDLGASIKRKLADGIELNIGETSVENRLVTFIEDKNLPVDKTTWFSFDRLYFDTGKSTLKAESQEQLKNIAAIMKAYPSVNLKLGGYTDNTGDPKTNLQLSTERAKSALNELVKLGVSAARLEAEGYGDKHPIASNDTPEGRAQNRRIDVRVTAK